MKNKNLAAWLIYAIAAVIVILGLVITPGCTTLEDPYETLVQNSEAVKIIRHGVTCYTDVARFEYSGHQYIMFGGGPSQTAVHDPDCPCHNGELIYIED